MTYIKQRVIDAALDLLDRESAAAFVLPLPDGRVAEENPMNDYSTAMKCAELLEFQQTAILKNGLVRAAAAALTELPPNVRLNVAIANTKDAAMELVAATLQEPTQPNQSQFDLSDSELRLMAGEMTAQELRTVRAVLNGLKARAQEPAQGDREPTAWRCFFCDEVYTDTALASDHFGKWLGSTVACQIDATKYRAMEDRVQLYDQEDSALHRDKAVTIIKVGLKIMKKALKASQCNSVPAEASHD